MEQKIMNRWLSLVGAMLVIPCLGAVYAWSIFQTPLQELFGEKMGVAPEALATQISMVFSVTILVFGVTALFGGMIQDRIGPQKVTIIGGLLLGASLMLASRATSIAQIYFFYGIIGGTGLGFAYITPLATCNKWFPDKKGMISGVVVAGMGLGSLVFTPIGRMMVLSRGVMSTWFILGLIFMVMITAGSYFLKLPPKGYKPEGWEPTVLGKATVNFTQKEMLSTPTFYLLWIMFLIGSAAGLMVIGLASPIGQQIAGLTAWQAAGVVSLLGIFNGLGRIIWGTASDRIGRTKTLFALFITTALAMFSFSFVSSLIPFFISIATVTLCFGGYLAVFPATTAEFFGTKNLGGNYGLIYMAYGVGAPVGMYLGSSLDLRIAFISSAALCLGAAALAFITKVPEKKAISELELAT
jgi:OFA family oxalate/formate antiporter-like MFS transporter